MSIVLKPSGDGRLSLKGFVEHVRQVIDLQEPDSLIGLASPLCMLANDPDVVARHFNDAIRLSLDTSSPPADVSSSVTLAEEAHFVLGANVWMPPSIGEPLPPNGIAAGRVHNHNTSLMTVGYAGPGCDLDLYAYDPNSSQGALGEHVDLRFIERTRLTPRTVVIYREVVDAHARFAPSSLSVSLTFSVIDERVQRTDQLLFDAHNATIAGFGPHAAAHRRASVVKLAGEFGNAGTIDLLDGLLRRSHCRRVREAAVDAAMRLRHTTPGERARVIERALRDSSELVRRRAEAAAAQLEVDK
jgi:hypothetical protein